MDHHYHRISATKSDGVGQGKLYSPDHAIKVATKLDAIKIATSPERISENSEEEKQRLKSLATVKDKVVEKLAAAAVPSESLENAKQFLEGVIKDFAGAAQGMTKDALHRIKTHLAVILPSVSPSVTGKIVDDAEKEAINGDEEEDERKPKASSRDGSAGELPFSKL
ncbi:hypothetical protein DY000_02054965 [Brassica cretica]|uniref:Uncharacterized protein n=1 Tax=Brassica cretica TaxID=69181 RepID=A0ABQ7AH61_BRACR|nr:hypothetical protein DY000_02054965 [Brassica cretica]